MSWVRDHLGLILELTLRHTVLAGIPLLLGLVLSIPLGWLARRYRVLAPVALAGTGLLYTIPSLALFILMPLILGTRILDPINVIAAMTIYTVALLVRTVVDGLASVPAEVDAAARAMGLTGLRRLVTVQLPLAVPVIAAGLRVAAVSNVSIVSVASIIGVSQLGSLLVDGYNRNIPGALWAGIIASLILALLFDLVIQGGAWLLTPWRRTAAPRPAGVGA
jgi:osmoprotectant transport system permease protein